MSKKKINELVEVARELYLNDNIEELGRLVGRIRFWCDGKLDFTSGISEEVVEEVERLKESIARDLKEEEEDPEIILESVQKLMEYTRAGYALTEDVWESAEANFDLYINECNEAALLHVEHDLIKIIERETEWDPTELEI